MTTRIEKMRTHRGGFAKDNFIVHAADGSRFLSYNTTIAHRAVDGSITLDRAYWDYSATTGRYRNAFLGEGIADTRKRIASGEYKLADLN